MTGRMIWAVWSLAWFAIWAGLSRLNQPRRICVVTRLAPPGCLQQGTSGSWAVCWTCAVLAALSVLAIPAVLAIPGIFRPCAQRPPAGRV